MTVWIFFGSEEGGAGTGAGGGTDAIAGGATAGGGAAGTGAIGATAPDPRALGGGALGLGEIGAVFLAAPECRVPSVRRIFRSNRRSLWTFGSNCSARHRRN